MSADHFRKWISLGGRIGRAEYWLIYMLPSAVLVALSVWVAVESEEVRVLVVGGLAAACLFTFGHVKRFRDLKLPGVAGIVMMGVWWALLIVPVLSVLSMVFSATAVWGFFYGITNGQWSPNLPIDVDLDVVITFYVILVGTPFLVAGFVPGVSARESDDRPRLGNVAKRAGVSLLTIGLAGSVAWYFLISEPAIIQAVESRQVEQVRATLERGANPDQRTRGNTVAQKGTSALEIASSMTLNDPAAAYDIVAALLEYGADASGKPLLTAIRYGGSAMVALMLAHGADVNASIPRDVYEGNEHPLWIAVDGMFARKDGLAIVKLLLENGAYDSKAFVRLIQYGHIELVESALDQGFDVNGVYAYTEEAQGWNGPEGWLVYETTPLMAALRSISMSSQILYLEQEQIDMVRLLVERGADPRLPVGGVSPLMWLEDIPAEAATSRGYRTLRQLLRAAD